MENTSGKPALPTSGYDHSGLRSQAPLHLLTSFANPCGGSENRTLGLHALLHLHGSVSLWSDHPPARGFATHPIRVIHPFRGEFPFRGTLVIVGPHTEVGDWLKHASLDRVVVHANLHPYHFLFALLEKLDRLGIAEPEIVYSSCIVKEEIGLPGRVEASPINLSAFRPPDGQPERPFMVGRLSRDQPFKHHPEDPALYMMLAEAGCAVRVMGGTTLCEHIQASAEIELLSEGAFSAPLFLHGLDCFLYRTSEQLSEPFARVVFEAMACGLPVVCGKRGGYAEHIRHGENGFLVDNQEEAFDILMRLKDDPFLRESIGRAARATVQTLYDERFELSLLDFYFGLPVKG